MSTTHRFTLFRFLRPITGPVLAWRLAFTGRG